MEEKNWLDLILTKNQVEAVLNMNEQTQRYGLSLTKEEAEALIQRRQECLKKERRVEFGESILPKLIDTFCDSAYIERDQYADVLAKLQDIFYLYKNEMMDEITDDELLEFMKEQFETVCFGDLDYLEGTCLEIFAEAIRAGYRDYVITGGRGEWKQFDIVKRWDREVFLQALSDLT